MSGTKVGLKTTENDIAWKNKIKRPQRDKTGSKGQQLLNKTREQKLSFYLFKF